MGYKYTRDDPLWVQAERVMAAVPDGMRVNVIAYDETFEMCKVGWSNPFMDKSKSDTLVQNSQGDWLKVWWYDADVEPFGTDITAEKT